MSEAEKLTVPCADCGKGIEVTPKSYEEHKNGEQFVFVPCGQMLGYD